MHPNKWCRRSLARPNRTTPEYHNVDHGVAVGWPRRFCVIAPIAFVGGMGGWCCRTWCAVVFAVVLRSVVVIFCFCGEHDRMENMTEMSVERCDSICAYVLQYHSILFLHTNSENLVKCRLEPTQTATTSKFCVGNMDPSGQNWSDTLCRRRHVGTCRRHFQLSRLHVQGS
jgi:hypothetical protein